MDAVCFLLSISTETYEHTFNIIDLQTHQVVYTSALDFSQLMVTLTTYCQIGYGTNIYNKKTHFLISRFAEYDGLFFSYKYYEQKTSSYSNSSRSIFKQEAPLFLSGMLSYLPQMISMVIYR